MVLGRQHSGRYPPQYSSGFVFRERALHGIAGLAGRSALRSGAPSERHSVRANMRAEKVQARPINRRAGRMSIMQRGGRTVALPFFASLQSLPSSDLIKNRLKRVKIYDSH